MKVPTDLSGLVKCVWKNISSDKESSTFEEVRLKPSHPLRPCLICSGFNSLCFDYRSLHEKSFEKFFERYIPSNGRVKYA